MVITPARDEARHLPAVVSAMAAQLRLPDLWLIVDDGSTDGTADVARELVAGLAWAKVLDAPQAERGAREEADRLALAKEARAFNWALTHVGMDWDIAAKLDADIVLRPDHYERLEREMDADARLGIAGCFLEQERPDGSLELARMPESHVNGALKTYRRACFEAIGGMEERLAWDTIDETRARMLGWRTHSFRDLCARHLRPSGSAQGVLHGRARHGACAWIAHAPVWLVLARSARLFAARPPILSGTAFFGGWVVAGLRRTAREPDPAFRAFVRQESRQRLRTSLARLGAR